MLSQVEIHTVATKFATFGIIPENSQPSDIIQSFQNHTIDEIHNITNLDKVLINGFINQTLPCLSNISVKYASNPNVSLYDMIWSDCFFYEKPVPDQKDKCYIATVSSTFFEHFFMFTLSVVLLFIFSCFIQRRQRACVTCCYGFPGPVVPLNMLDSYKNRLGSMLAFGVIVISIISALMGSNDEFFGFDLNKRISLVVSKHSFLQVFIKILLSLYMAIISYPLFVAQNIHNNLIGSLIGIFITAIWLGMLMVKLVVYTGTCFKQFRKDNSKFMSMIVIFLDVPKFVCLLLLLMKFGYIFFKTCSRRKAKQRKGLKVDWLYEDDTDWREEYMYVHVKEVFRKHLYEESDDEDLTMKQKIVKGIRSKLYQRKIGFQYSTCIIISNFVAALALYLITLPLVGYGYIFVTKSFKFNSVLVQTIREVTGIPLEAIKYYVNAFKVSYWLAFGLSILFYILVTMNSLTCYRRHILKLRVGDRSFLPNSIKKNTLDPGDLMTANFKFAGFQVGYSIWGFVLSYVVFLIGCFIIFTQIFLPMVRAELSILLTFIIKYWPNILIAIAIIIIQRLIATKIFLHDNNTLAVDNRRAYHIASYFFFFINILLGIASCLIRIIIGLVLGAIFMQRLSKSTLHRSYERRDPGYISYLGFILLEHQHSNPVLQCFVWLLLEIQKVTEKEQEKKRSKALIRWHLYMVLLLNPSIIKYRKRFLKKNKKKSSVLDEEIESTSSSCKDDVVIVIDKLNKNDNTESKLELKYRKSNKKETEENDSDAYENDPKNERELLITKI